MLVVTSYNLSYIHQTALVSKHSQIYMPVQILKTMLRHTQSSILCKSVFNAYKIGRIVRVDFPIPILNSFFIWQLYLHQEQAFWETYESNETCSFEETRSLQGCGFCITMNFYASIIASHCHTSRWITHFRKGQPGHLLKPFLKYLKCEF